MNVSEFIFDFFHKKGVDTAFMVAGGHTMFLNDALAKKKSQIKTICSLHEQGAAIAADAYGRLMHKPALVMITVGPAGLNALTGIAGAYIDSSPMFIISGQVNSNFAQYQHQTSVRQYGLQSIDLQKTSQASVKYFKTVDSPERIQEYLETAWHEMLSGRPGPVWIEVPLDIQRAFVPNNLKNTNLIPNNKEFDIESIPKLLTLLKQSQRPLILTGGGVHIAQANKLFQELILKLKIPVVSSRQGVDVLKRKDPLFLGTIGVNGERAAHFALQNADLLIVLGSRLTAPSTGHTPSDFARNAYKFVVDIDPEELKKPWITLDYTVEADLKFFLEKLLACSFDKKFDKWLTICQNWKQKYVNVLSEYRTTTNLHSYHAVEIASKYASDDDIIVSDIGSCYHAVTHAWNTKGSQRILAQGGLSTMGYWCAGIGASLAKPKSNIIVFTGDGSIQMNVQELAVVSSQKLPLKIFVLNNNGYLLIRTTQKNITGSNFIGESPESGLWMPKSADVAKAYRLKTYTISKTEDADAIIKSVMAETGPVLCEIMTDSWESLQPKLMSDKLPDGRLVAKPFEDLFPFLSPEELASNMLPPLERLK
ncbi:MAG: thiamine pyrophosphate-binding protein [Brevinema sp.]